ncbi:MAG: histidinol-phosphatase HisJ [Clostridium butyricum]|nr:histidinol-phosphatase HisJ [Clostridium butyricum]
MLDKKIYLRDGHIHSPYCPHGTKDSLDSYVEKALEIGLEEISFTEHMPLEIYFMPNKEFLDECFLSKDDVQKYFDDVYRVKKKYFGKIKINLGFEVDFIDGFEEETKKLLNAYGPYLEDGLLSVHFININGEYVAVDGLDGFQKAVEFLGSVEKVYDKYYETLLKAVKSNLGKYKCTRIGHPNLVRRFNELYPIEYKNYELLEEVAKEIKKNNYEVDINTAGLRKKYCNEIYVSGYFKELVEKYDIKTVFGSDSHEAKDVGSGFKDL